MEVCAMDDGDAEPGTGFVPVTIQFTRSWDLARRKFRVKRAVLGRSSSGVANFIVVGCGHCGSTSLFKWLSAHPQVAWQGGVSQKELNFFNSLNEHDDALLSLSCLSASAKRSEAQKHILHLRRKYRERFPADVNPETHIYGEGNLITSARSRRMFCTCFIA